MDDLLKRANVNRPHARNSAPEDTAGVLADIDSCLGTNEEEEGNGGSTRK